MTTGRDRPTTGGPGGVAAAHGRAEAAIAAVAPGRVAAPAGINRRAAVDRGAASILVLAIGLVLVAAGVAGAAVGAARVARHQAGVAADLGALAGAVHAVHGRAAACAVAGRYVTANAARMTACDVDGLEIVIHVELTVTPLPGLTAPTRAGARAGPLYAGTE